MARINRALGAQDAESPPTQEDTPAARRSSTSTPQGSPVEEDLEQAPESGRLIEKEDRETGGSESESGKRPEESAYESALEYLSAPVRGAAEMTSSIVEGSAAMRPTMRVPLTEEEKQQFPELAKMQEEELRKQREQIDATLKGESTQAELAEGIRRFADERLPNVSRKEREEFVMRTLEGLGSTVPFLAGGVLSGGASPAVMGTLGIAGSEGELIRQARRRRQQAKARGEDPDAAANAEDVRKGADTAAIAGATEALPLQTALNRAVPGPLRRKAVEVGLGALEEASQETAGTVLRNMAAREFDEDRDLLRGVEEAAKTGGSVGFLLNAITTLAGGRRGGVPSTSDQVAEGSTPTQSSEASRGETSSTSDMGAASDTEENVRAQTTRAAGDPDGAPGSQQESQPGQGQSQGAQRGAIERIERILDGMQRQGPAPTAAEEGASGPVSEQDGSTGAKEGPGPARAGASSPSGEQQAAPLDGPRQELQATLEEASLQEIAALEEETSSPAVRDAIRRERRRRGETNALTPLPEAPENASGPAVEAGRALERMEARLDKGESTEGRSSEGDLSDSDVRAQTQQGAPAPGEQQGAQDTDQSEAENVPAESAPAELRSMPREEIERQAEAAESGSTREDVLRGELERRSRVAQQRRQAEEARAALEDEGTDPSVREDLDAAEEAMAREETPERTFESRRRLDEAVRRAEEESGQQVRSRQDMPMQRVGEYGVDPRGGEGETMEVVDLETGRRLDPDTEEHAAAVAQYLSDQAETLEGRGRAAEDAVDPDVEGPRTDEYLERVATESRNPMEIAEAAAAAENREQVTDGSQTLEEAVLEGPRVSPRSFDEVASVDERAQNPEIGLRWLGRGGRELREYARDLSDQVGRDVSPEEIVDVIRSNPRRGGRSSPADRAEALRQRFENVTGTRLTPRLQDELLFRHYSETAADEGAAPESSARSDGDVRAQTQADPETAASDPEGDLQAPLQGDSRPQGSQRDGDDPQEGRIQPEPEEATGDLPTFREMLEDLQDQTDIEIQKSELPSAAAGAYESTSGSTIVRRPNDLDTAVHEVAHAIDDRYDVVEGADVEESPVDDELIPTFSQHGSATAEGERGTAAYKRAEGFAEWLRAYAVNPEIAREAAPETYERYQERVPETARDAIEEFGRRLRQYAGAVEEGSPQATTANIEMGTETPGVVEQLKDRFSRILKPRGVGDTFLDRLGTEIWDDMRIVMKVWDTALEMKGRDLDSLGVDENFRALYRLFSGVGQKTMRYLESGLETMDGSKVEGPDGRAIDGFESILEPLDTSSKEALHQDLADGIALMVNERVQERAERMRSDAQTVEQAQETIEMVEQDLQQVQSQLETAREEGSTEEVETLEETLSDLREQREEAQEKLDEARRSLDYEGDPSNAMDWVEQRIERLAGTGGGIFSDEYVADRYLNQIDENSDRYDRLKEFAERYRSWADGLLQRLRDAGILSEEKLESIRERNQHYAAFNRVPDQEEAFVMGSVAPESMDAVGGIASDSQIIYRFKGSTRTMDNPLVSLLAQTHAVVSETERNRVKQAFVDAFRSDREMHDGDVFDVGRIARKAKAGDKRTMKVHVDGEAEHWQLHPEIYRQMKNLDSIEDQSSFLQLVQGGLRMSRNLITYSPAFVVRQILRDPQEIAIKSESGYKPWESLTYFTSSEGREQFTEDVAKLESAGGAQFGWYVNGRDGYYEKLRDTIDDLAEEDGTIVTTFQDAIDTYQQFVEKTEVANRAGDFRRRYEEYLEQGMSEYDARRQAAYETRDLMDFAQGGKAVKQLNKYILFLNPAVQGLRGAVRTAKNNPTGFAGRFMAYALAPDILAYMWNAMQGDDELERWRQEPSYLKDFFYTFKVGDFMTMRIPKTYEFGLISSMFVRSAEKGLALATDGDKGDPRAFEGTGTSATTALLPLDPAALTSTPVMAPWNAQANYDPFRGQSIVSPYEENLDLDLREGDRYASRLSKALQKGGQAVDRTFGTELAVDARKWDYLIQSMAGGTGRLLTTASDIGRDNGAGREFWMDASGLFVNPPTFGARDVQWVVDWARRRDRKSMDAVQRLREQVDAVYEAENAEKRRERAETLWEYARELRNDIEGEQRARRREKNPFLNFPDRLLSGSEEEEDSDGRRRGDDVLP
jgi:hypothetical protein